MNANDLTHRLTRTIQHTMPTAAAASGLASPVDPAPFVDLVSRLIPYADRPQTVYSPRGLSAFLAKHGVTPGPAYLEAVRKSWIRDCLACESRRESGRM